MKKVTITVEEDNVIEDITVEFEGDIMPLELDQFINEHVGGRPNDRK